MELPGFRFSLNALLQCSSAKLTWLIYNGVFRLIVIVLLYLIQATCCKTLVFCGDNLVPVHGDR
jgi:hypothetical protein